MLDGRIGLISQIGRLEARMEYLVAQHSEATRRLEIVEDADRAAFLRAQKVEIIRRLGEASREHERLKNHLRSLDRGFEEEVSA